MPDNPSLASIDAFIEQLAESLARQQWLKLLLSKHRGEDKTLQRITIRPVELRQQTVLSFVYRYDTQDITKNHSPEEGLALIRELLGSCFKSAHFFTPSEQLQLDISKKGKLALRRHPVQAEMATAAATPQHNRDKKRFVDINRPFLTALGVTDKQQQLIPSMSRKWKQINKFVEVFSQAWERSSLSVDKPVSVVDFGSGKGYLTFAIHDFLSHTLQAPSTVVGVELRENLAALCNKAAAHLPQGGLSFVCGDVKTHAPAHTDVMIALHACDTATDYAMHYGIRAGAEIIMCSPCCHKQIRPQLHSPAVLDPMLQYGVHKGQQAEMVTDSLRALLLEAEGYSTKVFEFVSLEHTNKNKMILAVKNRHPQDKSKVLEQIAAIKSFYGVEKHCLESLLRDTPVV